MGLYEVAQIVGVFMVVMSIYLVMETIFAVIGRDKNED